jgi:hypothetical protein
VTTRLDDPHSSGPLGGYLMSAPGAGVDALTDTIDSAIERRGVLVGLAAIATVVALGTEAASADVPKPTNNASLERRPKHAVREQPIHHAELPSDLQFRLGRLEMTIPRPNENSSVHRGESRVKPLFEAAISQS